MMDENNVYIVYSKRLSVSGIYQYDNLIGLSEHSTETSIRYT